LPAENQLHELITFERQEPYLPEGINVIEMFIIIFAAKTAHIPMQHRYGNDCGYWQEPTDPSVVSDLFFFNEAEPVVFQK